jgi:choline-glycine betaine transporter
MQLNGVVFGPLTHTQSMKRVTVAVKIPFACIMIMWYMIYYHINHQNVQHQGLKKHMQESQYKVEVPEQRLIKSTDMLQRQE